MRRDMASQMRFPGSMALFITMVCLFAGCSGGDNAAVADPTETARPASSPTPLSASQATVIPNTPAADESVTLTIWWPDEFYPADVDVLEEQLRVFAASQEDELNIELRRKQVNDAGGIMSTLRSANAAAPGALPDLTLMRYAEFLSVVQDGLIYPMTPVIQVGLMDDLYPSATALSEFDNEIYGLPFALNIHLMAYHERLSLTPDSITFDEMLAIDGQWAFPAGRLSGVSTTVYLQYLSAGGTTISTDGVFDVDPDALMTLFEFYETSREQGTVDDAVVEYLALTDYSLSLVTGDLDAGVMTYNDFVPLSMDDENLQIGMIPTASGQVISAVDSWIWVMPNDDPDKRPQVTAFLEWMMAPTRQQSLTSATNTLPSQRNVLFGLETDLVDITLIDQFIENAVPPLTDASNTAVLRTIQNSIVSIINGNISAEQAVENVINQLEN